MDGAGDFMPSGNDHAASPGPTGTAGEPSERAGVIAGLDALAAEDRHGGAVGETCRKAAALLRGAAPASPAVREAAIVTCPQCEAHPCEVVEHDDAGVKWWTLAALCTECLEAAALAAEGERPA